MLQKITTSGAITNKPTTIFSCHQIKLWLPHLGPTCFIFVLASVSQKPEAEINNTVVELATTGNQIFPVCGIFFSVGCTKTHRKNIIYPISSPNSQGNTYNPVGLSHTHIEISSQDNYLQFPVSYAISLSHMYTGQFGIKSAPIFPPMFLLRGLLRTFAGQYLAALRLWTLWIQKAKNEKKRQTLSIPQRPQPPVASASPPVAQLPFCRASASPPGQLPAVAASTSPAVELPAVAASASPPAPASGPPTSTLLARLVALPPPAASVPSSATHQYYLFCSYPLVHLMLMGTPMVRHGQRGHMDGEDLSFEQLMCQQLSFVF